MALQPRPRVASGVPPPQGLLDYGLWIPAVRIMGYGLWITGFRPGLKGYGLWITGFRPGLKDYGLWVQPCLDMSNCVWAWLDTVDLGPV